MAPKDQSDDQLGRARVRDNAELNAYYEDLAQFETGALWTVANDIEPWEPKPMSAAVIWRHKDLRKNIFRALELVKPEDAGRRVVYLRNPKRREVSACCGWLFSGIQVMNPGEMAPAHNHAASAQRFIMEGEGAFTVVHGHKLTLGHRDFVITPNGTWHEHGVMETGTTSFWQDALDIPLTNALEANFYEVHPDDYQNSNLPWNASPATYGTPGMLPAREKWGAFYSPLMKYTWDKTYEGLQNFAAVTDGDAFDGVILKYVNPETGGDPMATMGNAMQMLRPAEHTKAHRHTGNVIYQVAKGDGYSVIGGVLYDWTEKDIFCVPAWTWHEHCNSSATDDACLWQVNDFPVMEKLKFYREQAFPENGGHQEITGKA